MKEGSHRALWVPRSQLSEEIRRLLRSCKSAQVSVAWASDNPLFRALVRSSKLEKIVVGTHFHQTDPKALQRLVGRRGAMIVGSEGATFHAKLYYFEAEERWACIIGSPNLTLAALSKNTETAILVEGQARREGLAAEIRKAISEHSALGIVPSDFDIAAYRLKHKIAKKKLAKLQEPAPRITRGGGAQVPEIANLDWRAFARRVRKEPLFFRDRLHVLQFAKQRFAESRHFVEFDTDERKAIAGILPDLFDLNGQSPRWRIFGSMVGHGDFKNLVMENPTGLSDALDEIPAVGEVDEEQYARFVRRMRKAFSRKSHKEGTATPTRLLAMKRPDYFLAINGRNKRGFAKSFGVRLSKLVDLDDYWSEVVERIMLCRWWQTEVVPASDRPIWEGRAALLDSLFYVP